MGKPKIVLKGKPSKKRGEELAEKEEKRLSEQIDRLGEEGLKQKQEELDAAVDSQELPSEDVLKTIPLGTVDSIAFR